MEENQNPPLENPQENFQPENKEPVQKNVYSVVRNNKILSIVLFTVFGFFPIVLAVMLFLKYPNRQSVIKLEYPFPVVTKTPVQEEIKEKIYLLKKDEEFLIPNTTISAILKESLSVNSKCHDCISSATLEIKDNNKALKKLEYSCGGFSGECIDKLEAFGYEIVLVSQLNEEEVEIKIINK